MQETHKENEREHKDVSPWFLSAHRRVSAWRAMAHEGSVSDTLRSVRQVHMEESVFLKALDGGR